MLVVLTRKTSLILYSCYIETHFLQPVKRIITLKFHGAGVGFYICYPVSALFFSALFMSSNPARVWSMTRSIRETRMPRKTSF